jgi:membrane protease subunit (stomatin/prohibitin family)
MRDEASLELVKCGMCEKATVVERGGRHVCPECLKEERRLYSIVRKLARDHEGSGLTVRDVAEMLGVDERKITHLVDSGYFKLTLQPNARRDVG